MPGSDYTVRIPMFHGDSERYCAASARFLAAAGPDGLPPAKALTIKWQVYTAMPNFSISLSLLLFILEL